MEMQKEMVIKIVKQDVECKFFVSLILKNNNNNHLFLKSYFQDASRQSITSRVPGVQTNNRAELFAVALALLNTLDVDHLLIRPDSKYVVNGVTQPTQLQHWVRNQWLSAVSGQAIKNSDLWYLIYLLVTNLKLHFFCFC